MPSKIKPKRSYTANAVPTTTDLETNELAINWADGKAFTKNAAGNIVSLTLGGSGGGAAEDARWDYFKPAAPTGVTATATNAQAVVSWTAPAIVVPPVTDYSVQFSTNNGTTWTTATDAVSTATSATITGLTNGSAHVFRVAGINGIGTGAYSTASAAVTPVAGDPLFGNVSLLLHMDGTGSTFVDSSPLPKTITAVGNATQSTAQSRFGGKSAAFDGAGDYLSVPSITLSGDFVFECWLQWNGEISKNFSWIVGGPNGTSSQFFLVTKSNRTGLRFGLSNVAEYGTGSFTWVPGTWYHVALVRSGSAIRFYVDGVNVTDGSPTASNTFTGELRLAAEGSGLYDSNIYLDDVRLTVGSNRGYTGSTITVPTEAFLEATPGTDPLFSSVSLLLHADGTGNTFVDSSGTPKTITAVGSVTQSATQSKWGGKSSYFNGSTGRMSSAANSAYSFGTGDFCVEMWVYPSGASGFQTLFSTRSSDTDEDANNVFVGFNTGTLTPIVVTDDYVLTGSSSLSANVWSHIAFARASGVVSIYLNGSRIGSTSFATSITGTNASIGLTEVGQHQFAGYIDDIRVTKGNNRGYTGATITVPTAAFPDSA